jgi:hypothetical protein
MWSLAMATIHRYGQWAICLTDKLLLHVFATGGECFEAGSKGGKGFGQAANLALVREDVLQTDFQLCQNRFQFVQRQMMLTVLNAV